jgi:DMSO/TMAO reductase YedYZ molybdopterin-dependent catalytic subunit
MASLTTGLLWSTVGLPSMPLPPLGEVSGLTVHVTLAAALIPFFLVHIVLRWPRPRRASFASRRAAIRQLGLLGVAGVAWQGTEAANGLLGLSGADRRFTGSRERGSYSGNAHPVTNWMTDTRQTIDTTSWQLHVTSGERRLALTYDEVLEAAEATEAAVLDCTGGWYTMQRWRGMRMDALLSRIDGGDDARSLLVRSVTGYTRRFDVADAPRLLLATHVEDEPLSPSHGAPLRLVAPGRRGYHWVKWVTEVELSERPAWWQPPLPLQ